MSRAEMPERLSAQQAQNALFQARFFALAQPAQQPVGRCPPAFRHLLGAVPVRRPHHRLALAALSERDPVQRRQDDGRFQCLDVQPPIHPAQPVIQRRIRCSHGPQRLLVGAQRLP